jgi:ABC-2 type transport system permease protein
MLPERTGRARLGSRFGPRSGLQFGPSRVVLARTARRAARSGALWGLVFAFYVISTESGYAATYGTPASRAKLAVSLGANAGLSALIGRAHQLDTVAGWTAWRAVGVLTLVGAVWGLLLATRLLRGEEDAGRWELYLAGQTTRGGAAANAVAGLGAGLAALFGVTALAAVADGRTAKVGFSVSASLFLSVALVAGAAVFLAVGVLVSQLAATRRQANGIGAGVLGAAFLLRMVADASSGLDWLRWLSPLGWPEELRPLIGSRPLALAPVAGFAFVVVLGALAIAGRRDLGASALLDRESRPPRTRLLRSPTGLALRLGIGVGLGWAAGLAVLGLVLGLVAQSAATAISGSASVERAIARLGGYRGGAASYLGVAFLTAAALVAFAAAGQVAATRSEEADGHVDHLLVRPVDRRAWLAGRLAVAGGLLVVISVVAGLAAWVGAASQHSGVSLGSLVEAGLNIAAPALFVLGAGFLVYGFSPRVAVATTYAVVSWSFLVEFVGSVVKSNRWLLDSSVFAHITPAPAADPNWAAVGWLVGLGAMGAAAGIAGWRRRDVATA